MLKTKSMFNTPESFVRIRKNIKENDWALRQVAEITDNAAYWKEMPDDELWELMFSPTLKRAWQVWSDGRCPSCEESVPMYTWVFDAIKDPWKARCPHCGELFPKNDFFAYYKSGLDERGFFRYDSADKALLFNAEHPDPADPLYNFGVDDGNGFPNPKGPGRWWFIAAYLIYGQWYQLVLGGINALAAAYKVTGDTVYSRKALILLDRIADLYPDFDFHEQGVMYDEVVISSKIQNGQQGFITYSVNAAPDFGALAECYDWVFEGANDPALAAFLSGKAAQHGLAGKTSPEDICRNIEENIIRLSLANPQRMWCNFPAMNIIHVTAKYVLDGDENTLFESVVKLAGEATAVDGLSGEKGLDSYAAFPLGFISSLIQKLSLSNKDLLRRLLDRVPNLKKTFLFHQNTLCLEKYYPQIGDSDASFACPSEGYVFTRIPVFGRTDSLEPSFFSFLYAMYEATGDSAYVQIMAGKNGVEPDMPYDLYCEDPAALRLKAEEVLRKHGRKPRPESVNYGEWRLAILRGGADNDRYAAWLHYDDRGGHKHLDCMNLGLFAHGLDLMPDFGYCPVQFGGWGSEKAIWYRKSAAHNTALIDKRDNDKTGERLCKLWHTGELARAITVENRGAAAAERFERTVILAPVDDDDFYLVDIFRIKGGKRHDLFFHSAFGSLEFSPALNFSPAGSYAEDVLIRNMESAPVDGGWIADFAIHDEYKLLSPGADLHLRCHGLTRGAALSRSESWINASKFNGINEKWIPFFIQTRTGENPLESCFVTVIETYAGRPVIQGVERREPEGGNDVSLGITLSNGRRDVIMLKDEGGLSITQNLTDGTSRAESAWGHI